MVYTCEKCGYSTKRLWSFNYHKNRLSTCSKIDYKEREDPLQTVEDFENPSNIITVVKNELKNMLDESEICTTAKNVLRCEICNKYFKSKQGKYQHRKHVKCKPNSNQDVLTPIITINKNNVIDNSTKNIQTNNITYNNYNTPDMSHITPNLIADLYTYFKRDIKLLVNDVVRRVYKDVPENDCIKFIEGTKSNFVQVQHMDQKRLLPVQEVCETILTNICVVCDKHMQDCIFDGLVIGDSCMYAAQEFEQLGIDARTEHKIHRAEFIPYVKSALL